MTVKRIVANIATAELGLAQAFYGDLFGLTLVMDHGWIQTYAAETAPGAPQLSFASEGGSGAPMPDFSIEVDDLEAVLAWVRAAGHAIVYGPVDEPWGVRRFFLRDPFDRLVNVLAHSD
ncbi:MAG: VOC family protein [Bosea sp.]|uniref:VOC family protein n=1 Tax=Bosea sp. (in: a-proteobacteria) TaxID=1871050 RepID=UPI001AD2989F|nr:VOC family protein [Bosea sp. (in: a-proteobacteria)]MBN9453986.1 VOC family protein [Bosea sp. (in: a-proteobacteria)]